MCRPSDDRGHALLEAVLLGLLLLVPLLWLLSVSAELHGAALATSSAAREAGFEAARSTDTHDADRRVSGVVAETVAAHGLDPERVEVAWSPAAGWQRGHVVEVAISYRVPVFQIPFLGEVAEPDFVVSGKHVATIDKYRSRG